MRPPNMLAPAAVLSAVLACAPAAAQSLAPAQCLADLEDAAAFLEANDAGAADALADHGPAIRAAFGKARAGTAAVKEEADCITLLKTYVHAWRPDHIGVRPARDVAAAKAPPAEGSVDPRAPRFEVLGKETLLLVLPTFNDAYAAAVRKLVADHRAELVSHRNWIIDVRGNGGGADGTYAPLLGWLLDGDLRYYRAEFFVTPANIQAQEAVCQRSGDPEACQRQLAPVIASMRAAPNGSFVLPAKERIATKAIALEAQRPARVAVLTDGSCGSSCEEFVLQARTGFRVKTVGRPTAGVLDVANVRRHPLPSGRFLLSYGTSRTTRLPAMRIDGVGIAPDVLLPAPPDDAARAAEVTQVQRWLETGRM
nr:S41 family peptidase [uncultured Massilia sp.]